MREKHFGLCEVLSKAVSSLLPGSAKLKAKADRYVGPSFTELGAVNARQVFEKTSGIVDIKAEPIALVDDHVVALAGRDLLLRRYAHQLSPNKQPAILYLHGGGFTIGSIQTHDNLCRSIAAKSGVMVLSLDYRLAPEYPFPAALDDALDALLWLRANTEALGIDEARIALGGDSAGGNLAAVTAISARDLNIPIALQLLINPNLASDLSRASQHEFAEGYLLDRKTIEWFYTGYLGSAERRQWRFAPLLADNLAGVAPAWFGLASHDPLRDEGLAYAAKLREANIEVDCHIYSGMMHNFMMQGGLIPEVLQAHNDAANALAAALNIQG
jgi:acetyl esterase